MKMFFPCLIFLIVLSNQSCTKNSDQQKINDPAPADTSVFGRLQAKWQLISVTHLEKNGPGRFQFRGTPSDYLLFTKDSIFTFVQGIHDDVRYNLLPGDSSFVFYRSAAPPKPTDTLHIRTLTEHLFVFQGFTDAGDIGIDSLKKWHQIFKNCWHSDFRQTNHRIPPQTPMLQRWLQLGWLWLFNLCAKILLMNHKLFTCLFLLSFLVACRSSKEPVVKLSPNYDVSTELGQTFWQTTEVTAESSLL